MQLTNFVNRTLYTSLVAVCALMIASCAAMQPILNATRPIHNFLTGRQNLVPPNDPIFGPGMKLFSPDESGWYRTPHNAGTFSIVKAGRVEGETYGFLVSVLTLGPDESRETLIAKYRNEISNSASARFKNFKGDVNVYPEGPGGNCLLRHWTAEDHAPAGLEGKGPMILESFDFVCIHPREKTIAANLNYSQRYFPGGRDPLLEEKASACIRKLEFNDEWKRQ